MCAVITIENVSKAYRVYDKPSDRVKESLGIGKKKYSRDFFAIRNLFLTIEKGETVGIIGRNGAGKSTLLKLLMGIIRPTEGNISVSGRIAALLELGAGFNQEFTGRQNIFLNGTIMQIPRAEMEKKLDDIIAFADIGEFIDQPVRTYSSGMFIRLAFSVAVHVDPDILIVDEALAVGDTRFQLKCMEKFKEFQEAGKTILFVSHDMNAIKRFCTRCVWLDEGRLILDGDTDTVTDRYVDFQRSSFTLEDYREFLRKQEEQKKENRKSLEKIWEEKKDDEALAEIVQVTLLDISGNEITEVTHGQKLVVSIDYIVQDETCTDPVLGVAIHAMNNDYICGLNTLLDGVKIPWKRGLNHFELVYDSFRLIGGGYYMDVAIEDCTATVNLDYRAKAVSFIVNMPYIGEGVVILDHKWCHMAGSEGGIEL